MSALRMLPVSSSELCPARPTVLDREIAYVPGSIESRTLARAKGGFIKLFAFDAGREFAEHTTAVDAFLQVLDGWVELTIGGEKVVARAGELVRLPAGIPHAVRAVERFKMLLTLVGGSP
jgi:quercetin dioxygenase-like cupin family protein